MQTKKSLHFSSDPSAKTGAIGVFDSGVGGLTALCKLAELLPHENLLYLGDTARVPYGSRSAQTIRIYAQQCLEFLLGHSVKLVLVACNTVSAVALPLLQQISPVPVIGVIQPTILAALQQSQLVAKKPRHIGIIGTQATIQSKAYEIAIQDVASAENIIVSTSAKACPLFVPLVEEGLQTHPATYAIAKEYLTALQVEGIDTLILGCTHYPLLRKVIEETLPGILLVDSSEQAAIAAAQLVVPNETSSQTPRTIECYTTDDTPIFTRFVEQLLHLSAKNIHEVTIHA